MNGFFAMLAVPSLSTAAIADEATSVGGKAPLMVSFTDLKWTELPERKGKLDFNPVAAKASEAKPGN